MGSMETQVLMETLPDKRFRVTGSGRFAVSVEADSREAAIAAFQSAAAHAEVITVDVPLSGNSVSGGNAGLLRTIGQGRDLPEEEWREFLGTMQRLREEENAAVLDE